MTLLQELDVLSFLYIEIPWMWGGRNFPLGFKQQATLFILTESRSIKRRNLGAGGVHTSMQLREGRSVQVEEHTFSDQF